MEELEKLKKGEVAYKGDFIKTAEEGFTLHLRVDFYGVTGAFGQ